jgi:hypothetical protein
MSLKDNLMEELQKLRVSRERPTIKQVGKKGPKQKGDKYLDMAKSMLADEGEQQ